MTSDLDNPDAGAPTPAPTPKKTPKRTAPTESASKPAQAAAPAKDAVGATGNTAAAEPATDERDEVAAPKSAGNAVTDTAAPTATPTLESAAAAKGAEDPASSKVPTAEVAEPGPAAAKPAKFSAGGSTGSKAKRSAKASAPSTAPVTGSVVADIAGVTTSPADVVDSTAAAADSSVTANAATSGATSSAAASAATGSTAPSAAAAEFAATDSAIASADARPSASAADSAAATSDAAASDASAEARAEAVAAEAVSPVIPAAPTVTDEAAAIPSAASDVARDSAEVPADQGDASTPDALPVEKSAPKTSSTTATPREDDDLPEVDAGVETIVHVLRHGEVHNPNGILYGRLPGFGLSVAGRAQAGAVARALSDHDLALVIASPLQRAQETAAPIAGEHGLIVRTDENLIEAGNTFEGLRVSVGDGALRKPRHWWKLRDPFTPSWGEPYLQIAHRMLAAVNKARVEAAGREAVLVSHQLPVWTLRRFLQGQRLWHDPRHRQCSLASLTSLVYQGDTLVDIVYSEPAGGSDPTVHGA